MPEHELQIPGTPPSLNRLSHNHWTKFARFKKDWQGFIFIALLDAKVPKHIEGLVTASAVLRFNQKRRRDEGNYRATLEKALGDALQLGWIPDDTPDHFTFTDLTFDEEKGKPLTIIRLELTDA